MPLARHRPPPEPPEFVKRYVFIAALDRLWDRITRRYLSLQAVCRSHAHEANGPADVHDLLLIGPDPVEKVDQVNFRPGEPEIYDEGSGGRALNLYQAPDLQPQEGDPAPFLDHLAYILDRNEMAITFILNYFAHLVQRPHIKIASAILIIGAPGTGKSMIANTMAKIVGIANARNVSPTALNSEFNDWIEAALLVIVHELVGTAPKKTAGNLKEWITESTILVNRKGIPAYRSENHAHFLLLSNEGAAIQIDEDDRRYFIWRSRAQKQPDVYYAGLARWLEDGGAAKVLAFLRERDLTDFDPYSAPPKTAAWAELVRGTIPNGQAYLTEALEAGEAPFDCDLIILKDVVDFCRRSVNRVTIADVKAVVERAGGRHLGQKRNVGTPETKPNVWALRNVERWESASEAEIAEHYWRPGQSGRLAPQPMRRAPLRVVATTRQSAPIIEGDLDDL